MSKILIVEANFPPEPVVVAKVAIDLVSTLSNNHQITVLCPKPTRPYGFDFCSAKIPIGKFDRVELKSHTCPQSSFMGRFRENYSFGIETAKYIHEHHREIDTIYADSWPLFGQYFLVRAAQKYNLPIAIHIQDVYPESLTNKLGLFSGIANFALAPLDKYILKKSTSVIVISDYMKKYLGITRGISKDKIAVVINWQDEFSFLVYMADKIEADKFTFMYLGNVGPVAGIDLLIDAFVKANIHNSRLVISGSGSMKTGLMKKSAVYKEHDIQFWSVPEGKVPEIQNKANVLLLPIKKGAASSSVPSKLPAYMLSAKPIICCADLDSYTAQCIREAKCGNVVEPETVEELSKALTAIANQNISALIEMGKSGRKYALDFFSKEINLKKLVAVIEDTLKK